MIKWWYANFEGPWAHYLAHFMAGYMIASIIGLLADPNTGLAVASLMAICKELMDKYGGLGTPDIVALGITVFGAILATALRIM